MRYYFRRAGSRLIKLPGEPGSAEFAEAYDAARGGQTPQIGLDRTVPGTVDALIVAYYNSAEWKAFESEQTRQVRKRFIDKFRTANGKYRVKTLQASHLATIMHSIDNLSAKKHWLTAIRGLLEFAKPMLRPDNPADQLRLKKKRKTDGHHNWTNEEIAQYRAYWKLGTQQRLAMEIGLEAVSRRCEIVRLGPQHVKNGRIKIERAKGGEDEVDIEMTLELAAAVAAMPKDHLVWFVTQHGKPRTSSGLSDIFPEWARAAGLPDHCRLHGLKKAGLRRMAEDDCTTHEMMATSGHVSLQSLEIYTRKFNRRKAADRAIAKRKANKAV